MSDSIYLRVGLLVVGVFVIAAIYGYTVVRQRRGRASQARRLRGRDVRFTSDAEQPGDEAGGASAGFTSVSRLVKDDAAPTVVPSMPRDPDAPPRAGQMEFPFSEGRERGAAPADASRILIINIESREQPIDGNDLVNAVTEAGLRFGEMDIFHHYGLGGRDDGRAVFSLANLYEPGTFDIQRMDMFSTRGVTLFLQLPVAGMDGDVACELFISTAERIANRLACRLYNQSHQELSAQDLEAMRSDARQFSRAR